MIPSSATTMAAHLAELPPDRRRELLAVRKLVKAHMPAGYKERFHRGMLLWEIPLAKYPETHNGDPLCYVAVVSHKHHIALYLLGAYLIPSQMAEVKAAFRAAGKKCDMGKSCVRFQRAEDLPLAALGRVIKSLPPPQYILRYEEVHRKRSK